MCRDAGALRFTRDDRNRRGWVGRDSSGESDKLQLYALALVGAGGDGRQFNEKFSAVGWRPGD